MKDSSSTILFHLLRAALGNEAVGVLPSGIDWKEVIDLSFDQGVAAIAVDGLGFAHDNDGSTSLTTSADDDDPSLRQAQGKLDSGQAGCRLGGGVMRLSGGEALRLTTVTITIRCSVGTAPIRQAQGK